MLRWPEPHAVDAAVRAWAAGLTQRPDVERVGYFGSYARGDWGVGSDIDLIVVVSDSDAPFERRAAVFDVTALPVPADLTVYTSAEWARLAVETGFVRTVADEAVWVYQRSG